MARPDLARPGASIDATNLYQTLVGRAENQAALEQRRILELGMGFSDMNDEVPFDDGIDKDEVTAFDDSGRVGFIHEARTTIHVWDSKQHNPGIGYPSCSRALARVARTLRDPNGYYRYIGVSPDATDAEVKKALRKKYRQYHPDGWEPNSEEFEYLREIAAVLTDPHRRMRYDHLEPGEKWLDSRVRDELGMVDDAIDLGDFIRSADAEPAWSTLHRTSGERPEQPETVNAEGKPKLEAAPKRADAMREVSEANGYDFFAVPLMPGDYQLAQLWYHYLVRVAPIFSYTRPMRVWLYDEEPAWSDMGGILRIPRSWTPGSAEAFALFAVVVGGLRTRWR